MSRTSVRRGLRVCAAMAAVAVVNAGAPAAHAATPCTDPEGIAYSGRVATQYAMLRYDQRSGGLKVCFQQGGVTGEPGFYGVVDIPLPGATVGTPSVREQGSYCSAWAGTTLYHHETAEGTTRISFVRSASPARVYVCLESPGLNRRVVVPLPTASVGIPTFEQIRPAPWDPALFVPWPDVPSSDCATDVANVLLPTGGGVRLSFNASETGSVDLCVRAQDAGGAGTGGRLSVDSAGLPHVTVGSDTTGCSILVIHQVFPGNIRIERGPTDQGGPVSVCVTSPQTGTVRLTVRPPAGGLGSFTPDPS